ncbi:Pre-mRNA cleavage complex II protein Clp1 [Onchocerca flexuosa]|uniref:Pre-mRNA cleavage complex II protein Clp1 n=1 Tax=Onchocerca flexuosa TaxID=387005 RepID=A0A238BRB1_9BILA|nr:Pre-mRNA cleavage complex II protein Clp1 [Onchocerca flexuosa]
MESTKTPPDQDVQEFILKEDNELRFEVANGDVMLELIDGRAEVFGTELIQHKKYIFPPGSRVAVFTWKKAVVELVGKTETLEQLREHAESVVMQQEQARGPSLMIVGPTDVGKTTVCRILCNYAVRVGRTPIFVDLDVGQGSISVPGTVGALYIEKTADVVEGFDKKAPLVYHFGNLSPGSNIPLYDLLVKQLAEAVSKRRKASQDATYGGVIINTCAEEFEVDVVIVLDHERLYNELQRDLPSFVKILHQPKSGGVENRSKEVRTSSRNAAVHKYFYGTRAVPLYPHTFELSFDEVQFCKIGCERLPIECLPFGMKIDDHRTKVVPLEPTADLVHHLVSLSMCTTVDQSVLTTNVMGFIVITAVDMEREKLTVLSPQPYPLPSKILILSEVTFIDDKERT